jgi:hypothetical protein
MGGHGIVGLQAPSASGQAAEYSWVLNNIASSTSNLLSFGKSQSLTADQIAQALSNLGISNTTPYLGENLLINSAFTLDQRNNGASKVIAAGGALAYPIDRWWAACTGANVTGQQVAGTAPNAFNYRFTGAAGNTGIMVGQRIEMLNAYSVASDKIMLSVDLANSLLTTVSWAIYAANSKDTFGTLASPAKTQLASGTFNVTSTLTRYSISAPISVGASYTNGIEVVFSVGAQTSGYWTIGRVKLEKQTISTVYVPDDIETTIKSCQRYFCTFGPNLPVIGNTNCILVPLKYPVQMRIAPAISVPYIEGNYTPSGSPTGAQWCLQQLSVAVISKTGTTTYLTVSVSNDSGAITFSGATYSAIPNWIAAGPSVPNITADAEMTT